VEDFARAIKQLCGAEDVRVLGLRGVARLVRLWAMARARSVGKGPLFGIHRMIRGLRDLTLTFGPFTRKPHDIASYEHACAANVIHRERSRHGKRLAK